MNAYTLPWTIFIGHPSNLGSTSRRLINENEMDYLILDAIYKYMLKYKAVKSHISRVIKYYM